MVCTICDTNPVPWSDKMARGATNWQTTCLASASARVVALRSFMGTAIRYLVRLHWQVKICLLPRAVVWSFPTVSMLTLSKASTGVSVIIISALVFILSIVWVRQGLQGLT